MAEESTNSIVEGCMPDSPTKLSYCGLELSIPENVKHILSFHHIHPERFLLYARRGVDDSNVELFMGERPNGKIKGGWPIVRFEPNFRWIYDSQRALVTRDGRIYIREDYLRKNWKWYLNSVPQMLRDCGEIFRN
jgi:hypothetical protein